MSAQTPTCPPWCVDRDVQGHWDYPGKLWQTLHVRTFGPVRVYVPGELHDDGETWTGRPEIAIHHARHMLVDGEPLLRTDQATDLAAHLAEAASFASTVIPSDA